MYKKFKILRLCNESCQKYEQVIFPSYSYKLLKLFNSNFYYNQHEINMVYLSTYSVYFVPLHQMGKSLCNVYYKIHDYNC